MLLTRTWAVLLAVLATACLAGMFLLSAAGSDFEESDKEALRAITEAGLAAIDAEMRVSPVQHVGELSRDPEIAAALERRNAEAEDLKPGQYPLEQILAEAAEELRVRTESNLTIAIVEPTGAVVAANGIAEPSMAQLLATDAYKEVTAGENKTFSVLLDGEIQVARVVPVEGEELRMLALEPLSIGAGSLVRRVLGKQPAGLVRKGEMLGDIIGDQPLTNEITQLAKEHAQDVPKEGASRIFKVGEGLDTRIGALGRVPGPAGRDGGGAMLAVVSRSTAAAGQRDLFDTLRDARQRGARVNWILLGGLLVLSIVLALYLPQLEALGPMHRLSREFQALSQGAQHQIFHDRYGGAVGHVARSAATAIEALRHAFLTELEIEDDADEDNATAPRPKTRTSRQRRLTRAHGHLKGGTAQHAEAGRRAHTERASAKPTERAEPQPHPTSAPEPAPEPEPEPEPVAQPVPPPRAEPPAPPATMPPASVRPQPPPPSPSPPPARPARASAARPPSPPSPPAPAPAPAPTPAAAQDKDATYREIFDEFLQVKAACGEPTENLSFDRFAAKLRKNEKDLKAKRPDIRDVQFTVYVKDGKAALKAKVVK